MKYTEQDVERVAEAIYKADPCFYTYDSGDWLPSDFYSDDLEEHWREIARNQARAALEAMAREPLEDVLRGGAKGGMVVQWAGPIATNKYWALVAAWDDSDREMRFDATGATIDEAIRAAVAAADEGR